MADLYLPRRARVKANMRKVLDLELEIAEIKARLDILEGNEPLEYDDEQVEIEQPIEQTESDEPIEDVPDEDNEDKQCLDDQTD